MGIIQTGRHFEIPSSELARWLDEQGADRWWNVDGDPLLTGRLTFPCPTDELASELRKINRPLLAQAPSGEPEATGQSIDASQIGPLVTRFAGNLLTSGPPSKRVNDQVLYLCWKGSPHEWLLVEDSVTAEQFRDAAAPKTM
jgi:hypothetical protein